MTPPFVELEKPSQRRCALSQHCTVQSASAPCRAWGGDTLWPLTFKSPSKPSHLLGDEWEAFGMCEQTWDRRSSEVQEQEDPPQIIVSSHTSYLLSVLRGFRYPPSLYFAWCVPIIGIPDGNPNRGSLPACPLLWIKTGLNLRRKIYDFFSFWRELCSQDFFPLNDLWHYVSFIFNTYFWQLHIIY